MKDITDLYASKSTISIVELVERHSEMFYNQNPSSFDLRNGPEYRLFHEKRPLNRDVMKAYTEAFLLGHHDHAREGNLHEKDIRNPTYPLLDTLVWWICYTKLYGGTHDYRSFVFPSSDFINGERLGVVLVVNCQIKIGRTVQQFKSVSPSAK